ncbi:helix-turn-helix domain-containing protein [Salibacterium sp. K-3]
MEKRTLGNYVKELRLQNNLSLRDLAGETDISYSYIHAIESGRVTPSREVAAALAEGLQGALPDELMRLGGYLPSPDSPKDLDGAIRLDVFASRLQKLISDGNWGLEALAVRTNIEKASLGRWLHPESYKTSADRPDVISLYKLASVLHVTPDYLAGYTDSTSGFDAAAPRPRNLRDLLYHEPLVLDHIPLDEQDKRKLIAMIYAVFDPE